MPEENLKLLGKIYELNCLAGIVKAKFENSPLKIKADAKRIFIEIQNNLFRAQAKIAESDNRHFFHSNVFGNSEIRQPKDAILEEAAIFLDKEARHYELCLPKLNHFIIPEGSGLSASLFHFSAFARNIVLEMDCWSNPYLKSIVEFLKSLAYFSFVLARYINFFDGREEREPNYGEKETVIIRGGRDTEDVVFTKENGIFTADVRNRGVKYNPNPYPVKENEENKMTEQKDDFVPSDFAGFVDQYVDLKKAEADAAIKARKKKIREKKQEESERTKRRKELAEKLSEPTKRIIDWLNGFKNSEALKKIAGIVKSQGWRVVSFDMTNPVDIGTSGTMQEFTFHYDIDDKVGYFTARKRPSRGCGRCEELRNEKDLINEVNPKVILRVSESIKTGEIWQTIKKNLE